MILSKRDEFADAQAITDTALSTSYMDLGASPTLQDVANGKPLFLVIQVDTAFTRAAGALDMTWTLESDSAAALNVSATVHATSGAIAKASLVAGYKKILALPPGRNYERYLRVRATASAAFDAGAYSAFLTSEPQNWAAYPAGA